MRVRLPFLLFFVLWTSPMAWSCGDPTDRPEDCGPNEYFDDARKLCFSCVAPREPTCDDGCGLQIVADDRGCPAVECLQGPGCDSCGPTEWVDESLRCAPCDGPQTCTDGEPTRQIADGSCTLQCI